jgi:hypothetical protein
VRPVWWCFRAGLRQDWRGLALLTLITALMGAVALTALAGVRRTDTAVGRFLLYAGPFQGQVATDPATMDKIAALPGIAYTERGALMLAIPVSVDGRPVPAQGQSQVITEAEIYRPPQARAIIRVPSPSGEPRWRHWRSWCSASSWRRRCWWSWDRASPARRTPRPPASLCCGRWAPRHGN